MKTLKPSDFPALRRVFAGYLHEDFAEEHGTAAAAVRAFLTDADAAERKQFLTEWKHFLERTATRDAPEVFALLARLGCRWTPPSREALVALVPDDEANPPGDVRRT